MASGASFKCCGKGGATTGQGQLHNLQDENMGPLAQKVLRNSSPQKSERLEERERLHWQLMALKVEKDEPKPGDSL